MKFVSLISCLCLAATLVHARLQTDAELAKRRAEERLTFQSGDPWSPRTNLNADVAMVYGIGPKLHGNLDSWRAHRYKTGKRLEPGEYEMSENTLLLRFPNSVEPIPIEVTF